MGCTNVKPYCIYFWPVSDVPSEASADRTRVGTPRNLRRIRCGFLLKDVNLLMFYFVRDKWPVGEDDSDNLDDGDVTHVKFGVLVMHSDGHCPDDGECTLDA